MRVFSCSTKKRFLKLEMVKYYVHYLLPEWSGGGGGGGVVGIDVSPKSFGPGHVFLTKRFGGRQIFN